MGETATIASGMNVGFNYPISFNLYGADFGPNPHVERAQFLSEQRLEQQGKASTLPLPRLFENIDRNLENLRRMGIDVVRFFLLANGFNYGTGPTKRNTPSPSPALPLFDWDFNPPTRADTRYKLHFEELLKRFRNAGMMIIPSFIDFKWVENSRSRDDKGLAPGGRQDSIKDVTKRGILLNTILADLLVASQKFKEQIFAWEVMNEPFWCHTTFGPLSSGKHIPLPQPGEDTLLQFARVPEVTIDQMQGFLKDAIQLIENMGFESTVGHRSIRDLVDLQTGQFTTMPPGSRPQFHYYSKFLVDPPQIKGQRLFQLRFKGGRKAFLGEFDSDQNASGKPWPELQNSKNADTTLERMKLLEAEGCELALIWPDLAPSGTKDPIKLAKETRQAIVNFTRGRMPPDTE